jgi:hypothetical protein
MSRISRGIVAVGVLAAQMFGLSPAKAAAPEPTLNHLEFCSPTEREFQPTSNNEYFPMHIGQESLFFEFDEGERIGLRITVLKKTETFYRDTTTPVVTRVVEELEWVDENENSKYDGGEEKIEVSRNYFAQTEEGTVCYFGEDVKIYEDGKFKGDTTGSWRADEGINAPGIIMPADPAVGDVYLQEDAPDVAQDVAKNVQINTVTIGGTKYKRALHTEECNLAELGSCDGEPSTKTYAPRVGLVQDGDLVLASFFAGK